MSPYRRVMGSAFETLPARVREFHGGGAGTRRWKGVVDIRRGAGLSARLLAWLFGFPPSGRAVSITVTVAPEGENEHWTRDFGGSLLSSVQSAGRGRHRHLLMERFGPARFACALVQDGDRLLIVARSWFLLGVPMPNRLLPWGDAFETQIEDRFCFDVTVRAPLVGLIVAYRGTLEPEGPVP